MPFEEAGRVSGVVAVCGGDPSQGGGDEGCGRADEKIGAGGEGKPGGATKHGGRFERSGKQEECDGEMDSENVQVSKQPPDASEDGSVDPFQHLRWLIHRDRRRFRPGRIGGGKIGSVEVGVGEELPHALSAAKAYRPTLELDREVALGWFLRSDRTPFIDRSSRGGSNKEGKGDRDEEEALHRGRLAAGSRMEQLPPE